MAIIKNQAEQNMKWDPGLHKGVREVAAWKGRIITHDIALGFWFNYGTGSQHGFGNHVGP